MTDNTKKRGFASMDPAKQREIASLGGRAGHAKGTAHEWTPTEAAEAGRKGGKASKRANNGGDKEKPRLLHWGSDDYR